MGEPQTHQFYDLKTLGRVPEPRNQLFLCLETPGYLKMIKKIPGTFLKLIFDKSQNVGSPSVCQSWRRRAPKNDAGPSNTSDIYQITINKYEMDIL